MNSRRLLPQTFGLILVVLLLEGCSGAPTEAPTASAPPVAAPTVASIMVSATPTQAADTEPWQVIREMDPGHLTTIAGFLNNTFGITAGPYGATYYTTDGGKTWPLADNSSLCRFGLDIVNEQVAWHCGNGGHVRVSADGGQTWQAVADYGPSEPDHCRFLSFLDAKTGWAATPDQLAATTDGGATWSEIVRPEGVQKIAAIALRTVTDGYVLDTGNKLFITQDGGKTWSARLLTPKVKDDEKPMLWSIPTAAVRFLDPNRGLVVMNFESSAGKRQVLAMRTTDGGQTWEQESIPSLYGALYLAHDGATLTITSPTGSRHITVLHYQKH